MSESDDDIIDVVTPDADGDEEIIVFKSLEESVASADEGVMDRENSEEEEDFDTEEEAGSEGSHDDDGQEMKYTPEIVKKEEESTGRQTPPPAADSSTDSFSTSPPPPMATAIVRLKNTGFNGAEFPFNRTSRLPNILTRQVRKRRMVGSTYTPRMKKDDPVVKERVLEILKNAEVQMKESVKKPLAYPNGNYYPPSRCNVKLIRLKSDLQKDPLDLQQSLRQLTRVDFGKSGENKCFVISDKLKRMIVEFEQATAHLEKSPGSGLSLKSCHVDLLVSIDSQLNFECTHAREKQYIVKHLSHHCGIYPLALMNKIARRRQEVREEAAYLSAIMQGSTVVNTQELAESGGIKNENIVKLSDLKRINEKKSSSEMKKNMAILVPRPKYLVYKPRVFKLSTENRDSRLTELSGRNVHSASDSSPKTPKSEIMEEESTEVKERETAKEEEKEEKQAADSTTATTSPQTYAEPSSTTVDRESPPAKFRKVVSRAPINPGNLAPKPFTLPSSSGQVRPNSTHFKPLPGSLAETMTYVQRTAVTSIKMRIDELRVERTKVLTDHGKVMDKMNHLEQTAIPSFLMRMNLSSRAEAMDAHLNKVNQYKDLKLQRQNLVERIGKINDDICNLLSASYSSV